MVREYVQAGYTKIHLDASMKLGDDDPARPLEAALAAQRAACLARVAEETLQEASRAGSRQAHTLRYVIGTEVPAPGGAHQQEAGAPVTPVESARETIHLMRNAFQRQGIGAAWERVIALVVQPGVEFGDDFVLDYQPQKARRLAEFIRGEANLVYEAHSTDYQTRQGLCDLVRDGFAILKVGPALTFAFREGVFALAHIEDELFPAGERSGILDVLEQAMLRQPGDWQKYYRGTPAEQAFKRKYSLSDRLRYYWPAPGVQAALARLLHNLGKKPIPLGLLSQYAPRQYQAVRSAVISNMPQAILLHYITLVLEDYGTACG
jgi:D-tagatose-1,6-bisphosphate aldolase subunit GatZ/KbaZ